MKQNAIIISTLGLHVVFLNRLNSTKEDTVTEMIRDKGLNVKDPLKLTHKTLIKMMEKVVKIYQLNPVHYSDVFEARIRTAYTIW